MTQRKVTDRQLIADRRAGLDAQAIADKHGMHPSAIYKRFQRMEISEREKGQEAYRNRIRELHGEGCSFRQIAQVMSADYGTVCRHARAMGLERNLSWQGQIKRSVVLPLWLKGVPIREIAEEIGVPPSTLSTRIDKLDLPPRKMQVGRPKAGTSRPWADPPKPKPEPPVPAGIVGELISTKGRWAELAKVAERHGWTSTKAQQEYHRARAVR